MFYLCGEITTQKDSPSTSAAAPNIISPTNYPIVTPPNLIWNINPSSPTDDKEIEKGKEGEEEVHHFFATPSSATSQLNVEHTGSDIDFGDYLDNFNEENGNTYGPCDTSRDGGDYSTRSRSSGVSFDFFLSTCTYSYVRI